MKTYSKQNLALFAIQGVNSVSDVCSKKDKNKIKKRCLKGYELSRAINLHFMFFFCKYYVEHEDLKVYFEFRSFHTHTVDKA